MEINPKLALIHFDAPAKASINCSKRSDQQLLEALITNVGRSSSPNLAPSFDEDKCL